MLIHVIIMNIHSVSRWTAHYWDLMLIIMQDHLHNDLLVLCVQVYPSLGKVPLNALNLYRMHNLNSITCIIVVIVGSRSSLDFFTHATAHLGICL